MTGLELPGDAVELLAGSELPAGGLYRRHPERNLGAIADAIVGAYRGDGPVKLGDSRSLVVIAVDGLGCAHAAAALRPDSLTPLTSEFPTTTIACLLTSVTGERPDTHGFVGVQYLHADGIRTVNCHDGQLTEPTGAVAAARPTQTPELPTVFDTLAAIGVPSVVVPNELANLHEDVRGRLLHGARVAAPSLPPTAGPVRQAAAFADQITTAATAGQGGVTWAYLDLDSHIHQHGFDDLLRAAVAELDRLAQRLRDAGTAVLIFADHGLTRNQPSPATLAAWQAATTERYCRLPPGGAGRTRWIYPHPGHEERLASQLAEQLPDAVVTSPDQLADWGLARPDSIGQRRLGEIVLIARGPDFPAPDATTSYEHGSMTADEVLIPMAIWSPAT
ncbi:MAG TPA: alkaline phosphatase family protein [Streptosporangiaceae bacterium]